MGWIRIPARWPPRAAFCLPHWQPSPIFYTDIRAVSQFGLEYPRLGLSEKFIKSEGFTFEVRIAGPAGAFLKRIAKCLQYRAELGQLGIQAAIVAPGDTPVGYVTKPKDGGMLMLLPSLQVRDPKEFVHALHNLVKELRESKSPNEIPAWTESWLIPGEVLQLERELELTCQIESLNQNLLSASRERLQLQQRKHHLLRTGKP
jgi:hypothetical protein